MDPWGATNYSEKADIAAPDNAFKDSFVLGSSTAAVLPQDGNKFEKLPDSEEYLSRLENRLKALDKNKNRQDSQFAKEQILANLIRSESKQILGILTDADVSLDREIETSQVLRQIVPKQPLTVGETVRLVESDHLDNNCRAGQQQQQQEVAGSEGDDVERKEMSE